MAEPNKLLQALEARLTAYEPNPVPLDLATLEAPGRFVVKLFESELEAKGLTLEGTAAIAIDPGTGRLGVSGSLHEQTLLGIRDPAVSVSFWTGPDLENPGSEVLLVEMEIKAGQSWGLATSFPHLALAPDLAGLEVEAGTARFFLCSEAGDADAYGPRRGSGLNLEVGVKASVGEPLGALAPVLKLESSLVLAGPATATAERESLAVRGAAQASAPTLRVGGLATALTLASPQVSIEASAAASAPSRPWEAVPASWSSAVTLGVIGTATLADGSKAALVLGVPLDAGPWSLDLLTGYPLTLASVIALVPQVPLLGAVPAELTGALAAQVGILNLTLAGEANAWSAAALLVQIDLAESWDLVPGIAEIGPIGIGLSTPLGSEHRLSGWVDGALRLGGGEHEIDVTVPLPLGSGEIVITSNPDLEFKGLEEIAELIGGVDLASQLPPSVGEIGSFRLASLSASASTSPPALTKISIGLAADEWMLVGDQLVVKALNVELAAADPFGKPVIGGSFGGTLDIVGVPVSVLVYRWNPKEDWELEIDVEAVPLPSIGSIAGLLGDPELEKSLPPALQTERLVLTRLELDADLSTPAIERFSLVVGTAAPWHVAEFFAIQSASLGIALDRTSGAPVTTGFAMAVLEFGNGEVVLLMRAEREASGAWAFSGELEEPVKLGHLVETALGFRAPDGLLNLEVTELALSYETGQGNYRFAGAASWKPEIPGLQLEVDASVEIARAATGTGQFIYSGKIAGDLKSHFGSDSLDLALAYEFEKPPENGQQKLAYLFELGFDGVTLTGTYTKAANGDGIVTVKLGGVTFGGIVGYLAHLVDPSVPAQLKPPWDVLNKINFEDLELIVNVTRRTIGIEAKVGVDLGLVDVDSITLTYVSKGGTSTVEIGIAGSFLGQTYSSEEPLSWDLLNEDPPATPGAGAALLDLQDLGVGQHLVLAPGAKNMNEALARLHEVIASTQGKEPKPWQILHFDAGAGWLIGAKFTVMGTVTVGVVFDDPVLYGAAIELSGPKAGPFAGLAFQILYRKVSADVGVYHIELTLPTQMRHLEFGEVSITLPSLILDIYTDGGFYVDLGFPYQDDWSVAFGLQIFPFVGAGGFYFGRLTAADGATEVVPSIENGNFGPVIEFGVALALGVGKEISEGPLSTGVSVTTQGILTGVVAWFNPTDASLASDRYYKVSGSLAIVGKLYGSVDFKVISVSISITATVTASVTIEAYAPIYLGISVEVTVEASIKILFVRIHFHFSMHLDASFTIGSQQATPWKLGAPAPPATGGAHLAARRRLEGADHLLAAAAALRGPGAGTEPLQWRPAKVLAAAAVIEATLVPLLTVAPDPDTGIDRVTAAMVPSLQITPPSEPGAPVPLGEVVLQPFDRLVEALLRWGMETLNGRTTGPLSAVDLQLLFEDLSAADVSQRGFDYADLAEFLAQNVVFALLAPDPSRKATEELNSGVLPMPPPLTMTPEGLPAVDFSGGPRVDAAYQAAVQAAFEELAVNYDYDRAPEPGDSAGGQAARRQRTLVRDGGEPLAEAVFADWLLTVARASLQAAANELKSSRYDTAGAEDSLAGIAAAVAVPVTYLDYTVASARETAASIAVQFGIGTAPLQAANPDVDFGNLSVGEALRVPQGVPYLVRDGDTAASIALLFGISVPALLAVNGTAIEPGQVLVVPPPMSQADYVTVPGDTLASLAAAWQVEEATIAAANPDVDVARPGTPVAIPVPAALFEIGAANLGAKLVETELPLAGLSHTVKAGDSLASVARAFRQVDSSAIAEANAEAEGILVADGKQTITLARGDGTGPRYTTASGDSLALIAAYAIVRNLGGARVPEASWFAGAIAAANPEAPPGGPWTVPTVVREPNGLLHQTGTVTYVPRKGDDFAQVAGYFALAQLHAGEEPMVAMIAAVERENPDLPPTNVPAGKTIVLPPQLHTIQSGDTLAALAARFDLAASDLAAQPGNASAPILRPNAELALPPELTFPVAAATELQALAAQLGISVDALLGRIGGIAGLFAGAAVARPHARQADVEALTKALVGSGQTADVAGMASHFLMHGLRLPEPPRTDGPPKALYRLTEQQFILPEKITGAYEVKFAADGAPSWAQPAIAYLAEAGDTLASIAAKYPPLTAAQLAALNPGIAPQRPLAKGERVLIPRNAFAVTLEEPTVQAQSPALSLEPQLEGAPEREPLFHPAPVRHSVGPQVPWTAPQSPTLPGTAPAGATPSLWSLPPSLRAQVAAGRAARGDYLLAQVAKGAEVPELPPEVASWSWATVLPLTVRRVASPGGGWLEGSYLLLGAAQPDRDALLSLWTELSSGADVQLSLAYNGAAGGAGLVSDPLTPSERETQVAIVRSNLSPATHSGAAADAMARRTGVPPASEAYASLAAPAQFLRMAWEASVTGTGGYYLEYANANGEGLPPSAFAGGDEAQVQVIAVVGNPLDPDRTLHRHTTAAVVATNLDPSKVDVFAYAAAGDTTVITTAPPGNVAFSLRRTNPEPGAEPDAETRTRSLFSLLATTIAGSGFRQPSPVLPVGPKAPEAGIWEYQRTLPVYKLLERPPVEISALLPPLTADPYSCVSASASDDGGFAGPTVELGFSFLDVFGNELPSTPAIPSVEAPVGYYDALRGFGSWPSAAGHFEFSGAAGAATFTARLDLGLGKYVPDPANPFTAAVRAAAAHQTLYGQIYYQLLQPDVSCSIATSLDPAASSPLLAGAVAKRPLEALVMASYLYLGAAASVRQVEHAALEGQTLGAVAAEYALSPAELLSANSAAPVTRLSAGQLTIPHYYGVGSTDTLERIAAAAEIAVLSLLESNPTVELRTGAVLPTATLTFTTRPEAKAAMRPADTFTTVAALFEASIAALAVANAENPGILTAGTEVRIGSGSVTVGNQTTLAHLVEELAAQGVKTTAAEIATAYANSSLLATGVPIAIAAVKATPGDQTGVRRHQVVAGETLGEIAGATQCTLAGLALANAQLPGLLTAGAELEVAGFSVAVAGDGSLAAVLDQLLAAAVAKGATASIGLADIADAIETDKTILAPKAELAITDYVVQAGDTVASLKSQPWFTVGQLARLGAPGPPGIFEAGTRLLTGTSLHTPLPGETFAGIAADFAVAVADLAEENRHLPLITAAKLAIPGAAELAPSPGAGLYVPLGTDPVPTLAQVAGRLGVDPEAVGLANAAMPGLLAAGVEVVYQGKRTTTAAASTLTSVAEAVGAKDAGALAADPGVAALAGLVAAGALFLATAPPVAGRSLDALARDFGVVREEDAATAPALALATANSAIVGLVAAGAKVVVTGAKGPVEVTAGANDTLGSLVRRLAAADPSIDLAALVRDCGSESGLLAATARVLVPPPEVALGAGLATPTVAAPVAPLEASITVARDPALVDPLASELAAVVSETAPLAPNLGPDNDPAAFAAAFEAAYSDSALKVATGPQAEEGGRRLWTVDFGKTGISELWVQAGSPRFYALEPISCQLESGSVEVGAYEPETGTIPAAGVASRAFSSVDLDAWMRMALEAIDLFLSPALVGRAWDLDPSALTQLVKDKRAIAEALSGRVQEILEDHAPAGLEEAQQALLQSMLVSLATAYTTDAVVQLPVTVESPFGSQHPVAPRLAGKPVVSAFEVLAGTGVAALLDYFQVSLETLAAGIAGVAGILTIGVLVGGSYKVADGDTVETVAASLRPALSPLALLTGLEAGTVSVSGGNFFRVGATVPVGRIARAPQSSDSFATLAEYFDVEPGDVAVANQETPRTLAGERTFEHAGNSYTTSGEETIAEAAQHLGYPGGAAEFAADPEVTTRVGIFQATTLHGLQSLPDLALSPFKLSLASGTRFANFLFSTTADASHRSLFLDLDLKAAELEFQIEDVPGAPGYQSSDWLRFALPLEHEALGGAVKLDAPQLDVPIALRSYPRLPLVRALDAAPTWGSEAWPVATIEEAKQWQLESVVEYEASAQDEVQLLVSFSGPGEQLGAPVGTNPLLRPLAQFALAWPQMQNDLAALSALRPGESESRLGAMVGTFGSMVHAIATALAPAPRPHDWPQDGPSHEFRLRATTSGGLLEGLEVTLVSGTSAEAPWPAIFLVEAEGRETQLVAGGVSGGTRQAYRYPPGVPALAPITQRFVFPGTAIAAPAAVDPPLGRDAVRWQRGQVLVSVLRNAELIPTAETNPAFVYETPWVGFANPAVPMLECAEEIRVGEGTAIAAGLASALEQLLGSGAGPLRFRLLCSYERQLVAVAADPAANRLAAPYPVFYLPLQELQPGEIRTFAAKAETQASKWIGEQHLTPAPGDSYVFDVSVYAEDDRQLSRPLVRLARLSVPIEA